MPGLFAPYHLKHVTLRNRIVASPMCQYRAHDGFVNDWHQAHYTALAKGGAGLTIVEASAVSADGRITPGDLGLWKDEHVAGLATIATAIKAAGSVAGIQLGHAGRKAGCSPPWEGSAPLQANDPQAWQPIAPSALPYVDGSAYIPREMTQGDIDRVRNDFVAAARRARDAGFDWIELHFAHGFLAQNFLSPQSNHRVDAYGGSLENRARFMVEIVSAVRDVWPASRPLTARLGMVEFNGGAESHLADGLQVLDWLKAVGLDFVDVGLALPSATESVPWAANLTIPYASEIRRMSGLPVGTSWSITRAADADGFVRDGKLDLVFFARTLLANPHWPFQAARELGVQAPETVLPTPYAFWLKNWAA